MSGSAPCPAGSAMLALSFRDGLPETEVAIGARTVTLLVDTGAFAAVALAPDVLDTLEGVRFTGTARRFSNARGEALVAREFALPEIRLGTARVTHVVGQELQFAPGFAPPNRVGYIGRGLLRRTRLLLDYAARTATLFAGDACALEDEMHRRPAIPLEIGADGIVAAGYVDGERARLVLDTGSTHSLLRPADSRRGATPSRRTSHRLALGDVMHEQFDFVSVDAGPPGTAGMLGQNFFAAHRVLIDFPGHRMWIAPPNGGAVPAERGVIRRAAP